MKSEFLRYFAASALSLATDYMTLYLLASCLGLHYLLSAALAFVCGMGVIYVASIRWVFRHRAFSQQRLELLVFVLIGLAGLLLNLCLMWLATGVLGLHYLLSKSASAGVVFCFNFAVRRWVLFRQHRQRTALNG